MWLRASSRPTGRSLCARCVLPSSHADYHSGGPDGGVGSRCCACGWGAPSRRRPRDLEGPTKRKRRMHPPRRVCTVLCGTSAQIKIVVQNVQITSLLTLSLDITWPDAPSHNPPHASDIVLIWFRSGPCNPPLPCALDRARVGEVCHRQVWRSLLRAPLALGQPAVVAAALSVPNSRFPRRVPPGRPSQFAQLQNIFNGSSAFFCRFPRCADILLLCCAAVLRCCGAGVPAICRADVLLCWRLVAWSVSRGIKGSCTAGRGRLCADQHILACTT